MGAEKFSLSQVLSTRKDLRIQRLQSLIPLSDTSSETPEGLLFEAYYLLSLLRSTSCSNGMVMGSAPWCRTLCKGLALRPLRPCYVLACLAYGAYLRYGLPTLLNGTHLVGLATR